jgi:polyhydroxyalkanoate synthesis regulator phasin
MEIRKKELKALNDRIAFLEKQVKQYQDFIKEEYNRPIREK